MFGQWWLYNLVNSLKVLIFLEKMRSLSMHAWFLPEARKICQIAENWHYLWSLAILHRYWEPNYGALEKRCVFKH